MNSEDRENRDRAKELESVYRRFSRSGMWRLKARRRIKSVTWFVVVAVVSISKRVFDLVVSLALAIILSPLMIVGWFLSGRSLKRSPRLGKWGETFEEFSFHVRKGLPGKIIKLLHIRRLPALINIIRGDMSIVGPRPASPGDFSFQEKAARKRYNFRPGLISLWWIRKRANIDYGSELDIDMEYIKTHSLMSDLGICLRAIPAILYGEGVPTAPEKLTILGININNYTMSEAIDVIMTSLADTKSRQICFVNADCANIAYTNPDYLKVLNSSSMCLADGVGLKLAGKLLGQDIAQNVNGTDMFPLLCKALEQSDFRLFLLGARPEVVEGVAEYVSSGFPDLKLCGYHHGYFTPEEQPEILEKIRDSGAHLLLVAFGAPKQDQWIHDNLIQTNVTVAMGVGGLFDFYSGRIPRAPVWMREIGMEWFYRFTREPGRLWKRYFIGNGLFLTRVAKEKFFHRKKDFQG